MTIRSARPSATPKGSIAPLITSRNAALCQFSRVNRSCAIRVVSAATTNGPRFFRKPSISASAPFCSLDLFAISDTEARSGFWQPKARRTHRKRRGPHSLVRKYCQLGYYFIVRWPNAQTTPEDLHQPAVAPTLFGLSCSGGDKKKPREIAG